MEYELLLLFQTLLLLCKVLGIYQVSLSGNVIRNK